MFGDTGNKNKSVGGSIASLTVTLTPTKGGLVLVGAAIGNFASAQPSSGFSDTGTNSWTKAFGAPVSSGTTRYEASLGWMIAAASGAITITVSAGQTGCFMSLFAHEFYSPAASPANGTPVTNSSSAGSTTASTSAMTATNFGALYVGVECGGGGSPVTITENDAAGTSGWTLSNKDEVNGNDQPGSMVYKIIPGLPTSQNAAWTIATGAAPWVAGLAAFQPFPDVDAFQTFPYSDGAAPVFFPQASKLAVPQYPWSQVPVVVGGSPQLFNDWSWNSFVRKSS